MLTGAHGALATPFPPCQTLPSSTSPQPLASPPPHPRSAPPRWRCREPAGGSRRGAMDSTWAASEPMAAAEDPRRRSCCSPLTNRRRPPPTLTNRRRPLPHWDAWGNGWVENEPCFYLYCVIKKMMLTCVPLEKLLALVCHRPKFLCSLRHSIQFSK
jgi:hypothetical protein